MTIDDIQARMMKHNLEENYKALCDKIKVMLLDMLITQGKELKIKGWTLNDLEVIKLGVQEQIEEKKNKEIEQIANVINDLIGRFGTETPKGSDAHG